MDELVGLGSEKEVDASVNSFAAKYDIKSWEKYGGYLEYCYLLMTSTL